MFRKKKKKELEELGINEEEIIAFDDFKDLNEKDIEEGDAGPTEFEKHFIFHISGGCPICGSDVKGNDYFGYLCKQCNVLFDRKHVIDSEFGRKTCGVRKTRLTEKEREELEKRRRELKDRVFREFSEKERQELKEEAKEKKEPETEEAGEQEQEEVEAEIIPPYDKERDKEDGEKADEEEPAEETEPKGIDEVIDKVPDEDTVETVEGDDEESEEEGSHRTGEVPDEEEDDRQRREEYELESPDKIIASNGSKKMHKGDCHFVKKIHPKNRIYLDSIEQGKELGYEMCVCLRRLRAMQR